MSKKIAVVTGSSSGFGKLIAEGLADAGYRTFGTMRDAHGRNAEAAKALEARGIEVVELDILDQPSIDRAAERILGDAGAVDVLVNNAGPRTWGSSRPSRPSRSSGSLRRTSSDRTASTGRCCPACASAAAAS